MSIFVLKYQRFSVMDLDISISSHGFTVNKMLRIRKPDMLPLALANVKYRDMPTYFKKWYLDRMIPKTRQGIETVIKQMSLSLNPEDCDVYGLLQIMSLLSYGRNMTDKYWITPITSTRNPQNFVIKTNDNNFGLNGQIIIPRFNYKHMDFHKKNGIAQNFGHFVLNPEDEPAQHTDFQTPDFCTNGEIKKRIVKDEYGFWIEKYMDHLSFQDFKQFAGKLLVANQSYTDIFPPIQFLKDEKNYPIGYRTRFFTNAYTDFVSLKDLCKYGNYKKESCYEFSDLQKAITTFELDKNDLQAKLQILQQFLSGDTIFENAGFLIDCDTKELRRFVAWL